MTVNFSGPTKVEPASMQVKHEHESQADYVKNIRKKKLQREVFADPSMAAKLVKAEASPVYNARGELIQTLNVSSGS